MASVWDVYNEHWGKETYKINQRRMETKKAIETTIYILWVWMCSMSFDRFDSKRLIFGLRISGFGTMNFSLPYRFKFLKKMSSRLFPSFVPELEDDWAFQTLDVVGSAMERSIIYSPWNHPPPVEKSFLKNLGYHKKNLERGRAYVDLLCTRNSESIRNLDAILALP